jgi:hypothetical protein
MDYSILELPNYGARDMHLEYHETGHSLDRNKIQKRLLPNLSSVTDF